MFRRTVAFVAWLAGAQGLVGFGAGVGARAALAASADEGSPVLPVQVRVFGGTHDDAARTALDTAARRAKLRAPVTVELAGPPLPHAPGLLADAVTAAAELRFAESLAGLEAAVAEAASTGAAGLSDVELSDVYLFRAIARDRARPRAGAGQKADTSPRSWEDYVRAATVKPERTLDPGRFPPAVQDEWRRAAAEVARRPHGTLVVRAAADAAIVIDGRAPVRSPAVVAGLPYGEHHVRVEEPGRMPWATVVPLSSPTLEVEAPARAALELDDAAAAAEARRHGARFALVAQPRIGGAENDYELRLVDASSGRRRDAALVDLGRGDAALDGEIERLLAATGERPAPASARPDLLAAPPTPPREEPGWARRHAWWLAAGGAVLAVAAGALAAVALSSGGGTGTGFSASADPRTIGR